jgi:hypothetical protein
VTLNIYTKLSWVVDIERIVMTPGEGKKVKTSPALADSRSSLQPEETGVSVHSRPTTHGVPDM